MSVTAVPLRPIAKGSLSRLWMGVAGVALAWLSGWGPLDSIVALLVAAHIVRTGQSLVRESMGGLMDRALSGEDREAIASVLSARTGPDVPFPALRTRKAGRRTFISVHVLVPGEWSVKEGHDLLERVEERTGFSTASTGHSHDGPHDEKGEG